METIENNKLLAEFLGYKPNTNGVYPIVCINEGKGWHLETMKFSYDWNWLMQVVEKIFKITDLDNDYLTNLRNVLWDIPNKEAVYNACVEFIKLYNQNK
jgi:hypothetical protein